MKRGYHCNDCDSLASWQWERYQRRRQLRNRPNRLWDYLDWSELARAERRERAELARQERDLALERERLAALEREEAQTRARDHFSPAWSVAGYGARAALLWLVLLGPVVSYALGSFLAGAWLVAGFALLIALTAAGGLAYDWRRAEAKAARLRDRRDTRLAAWREYTGVGEFGPLEPLLGYTLTVPQLREVVDEEAGTVSVDFCTKTIEWGAEGWRERQFHMAERLLVEDEAEVAARWADFCAGLAEQARTQGEAARAAELARQEAEIQQELAAAERRELIALHAGIAERLPLPQAKSGYLP